MQEQELLNILGSLINRTTKSISMLKAFNNMITYLTTRTRPATIEYYQKNFKIIYNWLNSNNYLSTSDITNQVLNEYVNYLKIERNYKNNSINKHIEIIKHIMKFNYENEFINTNPIHNFKKLKSDTVETKFIDEANMNLIMNYLENFIPVTKVQIRNILAIHLLKDTGARLNELLNIKIANIDINKQCIKLDFTKTNKVRYVYFSSKSKELINKLLNFSCMKKSTYLFINFETYQISAKNFIYDFLNEIKEELNISISISPHKFRHTLASNLIESNKDIILVQKILGHSTIEMTKRYCHKEQDKINTEMIEFLK